MNVKVLQLHKRPAYFFKNIQDKYAINKEKKCFALADGTTQSFNSEKWAEIITKRFIEKPVFSPKDLIKSFAQSIDEYNSSDFEFSANPSKASLEKTKKKQGGTATFIGLQFVKNNHIQLISCGDTNFFKISKKKVECFPFSEVDSLDNNKHFINTEKLLDQKIDETYFQTKTISFSDKDLIILATDALSRLFLKEPKIISEFIIIESFEGLHQFCLKYWENKQFEEDDISAIIIKIDSENNLTIIQPDDNFMFPKEEEKEFIPTPLKQSNNYNIQEVRNSFNSIFKDFNEVKNTLSLQQILIFSILGMSIVFFSFLYFSLPKKEEENQKQLTEENNEIKNLESQLEIACNTINKLNNENKGLENQLEKACNTINYENKTQ